MSNVFADIRFNSRWTFKFMYFTLKEGLLVYYRAIKVQQRKELNMRVSQKFQ